MGTKFEVSGPTTAARLLSAARKAGVLTEDKPADAPVRAPAAKGGLEAEPLLTPAEVATMFRVDPKTVTRWAKAGKLTSIRTLGGHRRYKETEVRALLAGITEEARPDDEPAVCAA